MQCLRIYSYMIFLGGHHEKHGDHHEHHGSKEGHHKKGGM